MSTEMSAGFNGEVEDLRRIGERVHKVKGEVNEAGVSLWGCDSVEGGIVGLNPTS